MVIHTTKESLIKALSTKRNTSKQPGEYRLGFVPTMGALHPGHLSLVETALKENDAVVVSIFVNPTQFNNCIDLEKYPRNPEKDIAALENIEGDLLIFLPPIAEVYGENSVSEEYDFDGLDQVMEGEHRKGHFDGVGTVLQKFFQIINPDRAYFGEKDFQQLQIVKKLVDIIELPVQIVGCPILREENGLAMSSRNERLTPKQFEDAALINQTLMEVREKYSTHSLEELREIVAERFLRKPGVKLEYFEIVNEDNLITTEKKDPAIRYRAFIAAFVGGVRLIDNMSLN